MKTRTLCLAAAALMAAALALPLWGIAMSAPQYPDETLSLRITRAGIAGDVHEVITLQHYVGISFPTDLPELRWATWIIVVLAAMLVAAAFAGAGAVGRVLRGVCAITLLAFLLGSAAAVQTRLYRVGHQRDPKAPMRALHDFTPPLVGPVRVANFTVWSFPHLGAAFLVAAAALTVAAARRRDDSGGPRSGDRQVRTLGADKAVA